MRRLLAPGSLVAVGVVGFAALTSVLLNDGRVRAQAPALTAAPGAPAGERGKAIYDKHCLECHGSGGKGDGPAAHMLTPRPRDFTSARYKIRTTETGSLPTDADIQRSVRQGLGGSAMPAWQDLLSDADINAVVGYIKRFAPRFASEIPQVIVPADTPAGWTENAARGQAVYETLQCGKCHGTDGRGTGAVTSSFMDDWNHPLRATDLTEPWTFHGGTTSTDVYMRFRSGMAGTPMPSFKETASETDMRDLAAYVVALARRPVWEMSADEVKTLYARHDSEAKANPVRRGQYLVETMMCTLCHTPIDENRRAIDGAYLAGGLRMTVPPFGTFTAYNLTSDKETGLGNWTDDQVRQALTKGIRPDGSRMLPFPMDWAAFALMPADDIDAIIAYLRTLPPVRNKIPEPDTPALPAYLWGKFKILILGQEPPLEVHYGNAGDMAASGGAR